MTASTTVGNVVQRDYFYSSRFVVLSTALAFVSIAQSGIAQTPQQSDPATQTKAGATESEHVTKLRQAVEAGDADANFKLGMAYGKGDGVAQDDEQALRWFRKSAELGHAQAQFTLGLFYAEGVGQDDAQVSCGFGRRQSKATCLGSTT